MRYAAFYAIEYYLTAKNCSTIITNETRTLLINLKFMTETSETINEQQTSDTNTPKDSYVKLAMRNMVRKGGTSLKHFFLTTVGLVGLLIGLAYLTRP